jgi:hypothetical protein
LADFSQTITNGIGVFGGAESNKWNAHLWGSFLWGEGTADLAVSVGKFLSETLSLSDAFSKGASIVVSNALVPDGDMHFESLGDGGIYDYVFPGGTTDAEERASPTWTAPSTTAPSWTPAVASSTSWSQS